MTVENLRPYRVGVEVALRDYSHVEDVHDELEEFHPEFEVSERGWTVANVTVHALSQAQAHRLAVAVVVAALDAEALVTWLH